MSKDTATVERYSNWLKTDSEFGRCKHVGDFLIFVRPMRRADDGRIAYHCTIHNMENRKDVPSMWGLLRLAPIILDR